MPLLSRSRVLRAAGAVIGAAALFAAPAAAQAHASVSVAAPSSSPSATPGATPAAEFGSDWDDPRTAAPPVKVPPTRHCSVEIVRHAFADYSTYHQAYTPPAACVGPWSTVRLRLDGSVKGRQFDRLGDISVGGVRVMTLSTPEPSTDGISWHVEKDVTAYAPVLASPQDVAMYLGNTVDGTYTGVLDVTVTLDFFTTDAGNPAAKTADTVLPLSGAARQGADLVGTVTVPRNTERLTAEVYAQGSGGGCEEVWDTSAPSSTGYSCPDGLPYREVDVSIDGTLAGIAAPYPVIYTGGWSNPFLWYVIPGLRAFDIPSLKYDLTPFAGRLNDGRPHQVRFSVVGLTADQAGWSLAPNVFAWTDHDSHIVRGALTGTTVTEPAITSDVAGANDGPGHVDLRATRTFRAQGWLQTSHGRVRTTVARALDNTSRHSWDEGESRDELDATWHDTATTSTSGGGPRTSATERLTYGKQGRIDFLPRPGVDGAFDVTTTMTLTDEAHSTATRAGRSVLDRTLHDQFDGTASWIYGVPRDERHATGHSTEHYRLTGDPGWPCFDHTLAQVNGTITLDRRDC